MRTIKITTQVSAKENFRRFGIKGVSKIKSEKDFLDALNENDLSEWAELYASILERENKLNERYNAMCYALPAPSAPLKGRGYQRVDVETMPDWVTTNHRVIYTTKRRGGYFKEHLAVSLEAYGLIVDFENELAELHNEWERPTLFELQEEEARRQRRKEIEASKELKRKELQGRLSEMDSNSVLKAFFANEIHPAPDYVAQLKKDSGLSWSALRRLYS